MKSMLRSCLAATLSVLLGCGPTFAAGMERMKGSLGHLGGSVPAGLRPMALPPGANAPAAGADSALPPAVVPPAPPSLGGAPVAQEPSQPERVPVTPVVAAERLAALTPAQQGVVQGTIEALRGLWMWKAFPIRLPTGSIFDGSKPIIDASKLFQAPTDAEVRELAGTPLTKEQLLSSKKTGTFEVPSQRTPGDTHVWQWSPLVMKGQQGIAATYNYHAAQALGALTVGIPDRIVGAQSNSLRRALSAAVETARGAAGLLVGVPENHARYNEGQIAAKIEDYRLDLLKKSRVGKELDLRIYDAKLMAQARPIVEAIENIVAQDFEKDFDARTREIEEGLRAKGVAEAQIHQEVADALVSLQNAAFHAALIKSTTLESLSSGLGKMLADNASAQVMAQREAQDFAEAAEAATARADSEFALRHPILSLIPAWSQRAHARALAAYNEENYWESKYKLAATLLNAGLDNEHTLLFHEITFYSSKILAPALKAKLAAEHDPNDAVAFGWRIWRPSKWIKGQYDNGSYYAVAYQRVQTSTAYPGWRVANALIRLGVYFNNGLYHLLVTNLLNGPLGIRSLLQARPFLYAWTVDPKTGELKLDEHLHRNTLLSRLASLKAQRRSILNEFADAPPNALPKWFVRLTMVPKVDLYLGFIAPLAVFVGQIALTLANVAVSAVGAATAFAWAPAASLFAWARNIVLFDSDGTVHPGTTRLLPIVGLATTLVLGAAAQAATSLSGIALHIAVSVLQEVVGLLRTYIRKVWEAFTGFVMRRGGTVPRGDMRMIVKRIKGPGLSSNYFFQVHPDLVLVALRARLEVDGLTHYTDEARRLVELPVKDAEAFLDAMSEVTGAHGYAADSPAFLQIGEQRRELLKQLTGSTRERLKAYYKLLSVPRGQSIKLATADYELTLKKAVVLTRQYYTAFFAQQRWSPEMIAAFWKSQRLTANDWEALAKQNLAIIFGNEFLVPLEQTDKSLRLEVESDSFSDYATGLEAGIMPEDLANVTLTGLGQAKPSAPVKSRVPYAGAREAFGQRLLLGQ